MTDPNDDLTIAADSDLLAQLRAEAAADDQPSPADGPDSWSDDSDPTRAASAFDNEPVIIHDDIDLTEGAPVFRDEPHVVVEDDQDATLATFVTADVDDAHEAPLAGADVTDTIVRAEDPVVLDEVSVAAEASNRREAVRAQDRPTSASTSRRDPWTFSLDDEASHSANDSASPAGAATRRTRLFFAGLALGLILLVVVIAAVILAAT